MHAKILPAAILALLLGACSPKKNAPQPPPPPDKQALIGKWKSPGQDHFILGYDFASDGTLKTKIHGLDKPVPARFTWIDDRSIELEYSADALKTLKAAAEEYKKWVKEVIKKGERSGRAEGSMLSEVAKDMPAKETLRVNIAGKPAMLVLIREEGGSVHYDREE